MTWPQVWLALDDIAEANHIDSDDERKKQGKPPKPDEKKDPVGLLRWQLTYDSAIPMSPEEIESHCKKFEEGLKSGKYKVDG